MQVTNTVCHYTIMIIIAFSLPEIIKVLVTQEDVKFIYLIKTQSKHFLGNKEQEGSATTTLLL